MSSSLLITLFSLVGNTIYVNHIRNSIRAEICISKIQNDTDCYKPMRMVSISPNKFMYAYNVTMDDISGNNYLKINYVFDKQPAKFSNWIQFAHELGCNCTTLYIFVALLGLLSVITIFITFVIYYKNI